MLMVWHLTLSERHSFIIFLAKQNKNMKKRAFGQKKVTLNP